MKKSLMLILIILTMGLCASLWSVPLTGTYTIPGSYASIAAAITDLNTNGASGGVTFDIAADYTETITAPLSVTVTGASGNEIKFQKSGTGANPKITAYVGTATPGSAIQDGIWNFIGSDYITIDGIDLYDPNSTNPATMEYGYAFFKAGVTDGCQYNTIKNCVVTLSRVNNASGTAPAVDGSRAIQLMNCLVTTQTTIMTPTSAGGTNSYNKFYTNTVQNCNIGFALIGFAGTTPFTLCDYGNDIGGTSSGTGNNILNFGGATSATNPAAGVRTLAQYDLNVSYNTVNNNDGSGARHVTTLRSIYLNTATSASASITYNNITLSGGATTSSVYAIDNQSGSTAASNTININNNNITGSYSTATTGAFYAIQNGGTPATLNATYNTIHDVTNYPGTGTFYGITAGSPGGTLNMNNNSIYTITRSAAGPIIVFQASTPVTATYCNNNTVYGLTSTGAAISGYTNSGSASVESFTGNLFYNFTSSSTATIKGIYINTASGNKTFVNNTFYNFTVAGAGTIYGMQVGYGSTNTYSGNILHDFSITGSSSGTLYGIYATAGSTSNMYNNKIYTFSNAGGTSGTIYGIYASVSSSTNNIYKNKIYDLSTGSSNPTLYAIYVSSGTNHYIYNNIIGDLRAAAANANVPLGGIYVAGGTNAYLYYNTVYLNATSTGTNFGSSAIYASTTPTLVLRNNIFVNNSTPNGTGLTVAYRRSSTTLTTYSTSSNNNLFYAGTPGASRVIYYDGTTAQQTLANYKTAMSTRDASSITENPTFISTTGSDNSFLHINTSVATQIESGATTIAGMTDPIGDFDGDLRYGDTGYAAAGGLGTAPDIGADENNLTGLDLSAPTISYTAFANTATNTGTRTVYVTISDATGVDNATKQPRLYYKESTDVTWNAAVGTLYSGTAINGVWSFGIDNSLMSLAIGDVVQYFIVAKDTSPALNIAVTPSAGAVVVDVDNVTTPPTTPGTYTVVGSVSGTYTVGTSGADFTTLTGTGGFFEYVNGRIVTSNVTVNVTTNLTETGATALNQTTEEGTGGYTITIQPSEAVNKAISGSYAGTLIRLNGADRVIFDGRFSDSNRWLTISNSNATGYPAIGLVKVADGQGATYNQINYCKIASNSKTATTAFGIDVQGDSDNSTIDNNIITLAYYGINIAGTATSVINNLTVSNNTIADMSTLSNSIGYKAITATYCDGLLIDKNIIGNIEYTTAPHGISINANVFNSTVSRNTIDYVKYTGSGGYSGVGIYVATGNASTSNLTISNNMLSRMLGDGFSSITGGGLVGLYISSGGGLNIYNNSIYMSGAPTYAVSCVSAAVYIPTGVTNIDMRNNAFHDALLHATQAGSKSYAIYCAAANTAFSYCDNNVYYTSGAQGVLGYLGADCANITAWRAATAKDANSYNYDPMFQTTTNLHIQASPVETIVESKGAYIASLLTDIDGNPRWNQSGYAGAGSAFDIGADEGDFTLLTPAVAPDGQPSSLVLVPGSTSMSGSFTADAVGPNLAEGYLVVRYTSTPTITNPTNGTDYTAGTALGAGYVAARVTSPSFTDTGAGLAGNVLVASTPYYYVVFALRTSGAGSPMYNMVSPLQGNETTLIAGPDVPTAFTATVTGATSVALAATANAAVNDIIVVYNTTNTFGTLLSNVNYTAGTSVTGGGTVWYNGVATGLTAHNTATAGTTYYYKVYSVASSGIYYVYSAGVASTPSSVVTYLAAPYTENFNASTSLPAGWSGDMAVLASHGANGTNGIYYNLDSYPGLFTQSTPIIGSIPANYRISFDYRLINYSGYPGTATVLGAGNTYDIQVSTNGGTDYTTLYTINSTNHVTSLDFATLNIPLPSGTVPVGSNVKVRFNGVWASGDMYFDVDNFKIEEIPATPVIAITPSPLNFGLKAANSTNSSNIIIYNNGSVPMVVTGVSVASPFSCTYSGTIAAGANSGNVAVNYDPTAVGTSSTTLTVNITGDFAGTNTITVSGQAYPADYVVESFESATFPPADWSSELVYGRNWASSSTTYEGTKGAYLYYYYNSSTYAYEASQARLKTTLLQVPNDNVYFYAKCGSVTGSTVKVQYSLDGSTGWTDLSTITPTTSWALYTVPTSTIVGQYYLGFYGTTGSTSSDYLYFDKVIIPPAVPVIPGVATLVSPANAVSPTLASPVTLTWAAGTGHPTAYDVYFGTDNPPLTRVSELQTGLTYAPTTAYNTTYYWQIVPHTSVGYASSCPVWTFRTADDPIIYSFPYTQNWDTTTAPNFWTIYGTGAATVTLSTTSPYNGTLSAAFYNSSEATPTKYLASPQINADIDLTEGFRVGFYAKGASATNTVIIGTTDATMATFTPFGSPVTLTTSWAFYEVDMSTYTGTDNHIAFKTTHASTYTYNYIDNIQFYVVPSTPQYTVTPTSKDFGNLDLTVSSYQTFIIQNMGLASLNLSDITVSNTLGTAFSLSRVPSPLPSLAYRDTTSFVVKFNPTTAGSKTATVTVVDNMARASHLVDVTGMGLAPVSIATTPYTENFDGSAPYSVSVSPDDAWVIGTPAKIGNVTYPAQIVGPKSTPNSIVTRSLTGDYTNSDASTVTLPTIGLGDFPSGVIVSFWHNFFTETGWDAGVLEYSTDMGANWVKADATLGTGGNFNTTISQNWYNSSSTSGPVVQPKWSGTSTAYTGHSAGWIQSGTFISRTTLGSATTVKFRFRWGTDSSGARDGWAIDDIQVQKQPVTEYAITNLATTQLYKIANEAVAFSARVTNNGYVTTGANINFKVGSDVVATIPTGTINFGSYKDVTFNYVFPADGTFDLSAVLDTDENLTNNTSNTLSSVFVYGVNQLAEGFEGTFAPDRWATWTAPAWYQASTGYLDGTKCAALDVAISEAGTRYLSTPPVVVTTGSTLSFYAMASDSTLKIQMKYHAGYESGTSPSTWTWTDLGLPIDLATTYPGTAIAVDISGLTPDTYYFAFTGVGAATAGTINVDQVVGPAKFIPLVTPLKAGFTGPDPVVLQDPKTVVLDWTAPGEPGGTPEYYSVFYGESELGVADNQFADVIHPTTAITPYNLAPRVTLKYNTTYYWEVVPTLTLADPMSPTPDIWSFRTKSQISANDLAIGTIAPTEQRTGTIAIQNIGDTELTFSVTDAPADMSFTGPYTIPANSSINLGYTFTAPGNTGDPYSDTFTITQTAAPHSSKEIAVTATVTNPSGATIGTGTLSSSYAPLYYDYDYSWSRMIYTKAEINTAGLASAGNINSISFYVTSTLENSILGDQRIYLRGTSNATETTSYVDPLTNGFTECYVGELTFNGPGWYTIELTTPFNWDNNSNIEVAWENHDGEYTDNDAISFYGTSTSANYRTVYKYQDNEFPSAITGTTTYTRPNIRFATPVVATGSMSGYVTSGARAAVAGATVSIGGTALTTTTNAAGRYNFTAVPEGSYTVTCSKAGYYNLEHSVTITNNVTTTRDFAIVALPNVNITGHVIGNDLAPVVGATVSIVGPATHNTTTNSSGDFTFTAVAGDTDYTYSISKSGYTPVTGSVTISTSNYDFGTINMNEVGFPTYSVSAAEVGSDVQVTWTAAGPPPVQTFDFESTNGGFTATSWTSTGWSWGTSANHGAHGGTKVWGCMLSGNYGVTGTVGVYGYYELVSPSIDLYSGASLSFWHKYYFEGSSTFYDGGRVQVSTDNGLNWTTITPTGGYPCADISSFGDGTFPGYGSRNDTNWSQANFSLAAYANQTIKIKWQMAVDHSVAYLGWTIDDVSVTTASRSAAPTKITALNDRSVIGYNVYRFAAADEATPAAWTKIADSIEPTTSYTDTEWSTLPGGSFKWAVEAIYSGGTLISPVTKSNSLYHLTAPTGLAAVLDGGNIHISWTGDAQATGYKVYISDDASAPFESWTFLATVTSPSYDYAYEGVDSKFFKIVTVKATSREALIGDSPARSSRKVSNTKK